MSTQFYRSDAVVLGTYLSEKEAIDRIEKDTTELKPMETNICGSFWRTPDNSLRFWIKTFPLGDCPLEVKDQITTRGQSWRRIE